jgi:ribosomal protein S18 acetylase RimI-like enzyme
MRTNKEPYRIRRFADPDRAAVAALWTEVFADDPPWNTPDLVIAQKLRVQPELFLVCEKKDRIVATVIGGFDGFRGWAYHLAVSSGERRHGIGRAMMQALEGRLERMGCPKLNLQVRAGNDEAVAFYRALGYGVEDRVSMAKQLRG